MKYHILQIIPISQKYSSNDTNIIGLALVEQNNDRRLKLIGIDTNGELKLVEENVSSGHLPFGAI